VTSLKWQFREMYLGDGEVATFSPTGKSRISDRPLADGERDGMLFRNTQGRYIQGIVECEMVDSSERREFVDYNQAILEQAEIFGISVPLPFFGLRYALARNQVAYITRDHSKLIAINPQQDPWSL